MTIFQQRRAMRRCRVATIALLTSAILIKDTRNNVLKLTPPLGKNQTASQDVAMVMKESVQVDTTLIIATVPHDRDHAKALWSHLECLTEKIDRVVVAAPDVDWSRNIVEAIITNFKLQAAINQISVPIIEPAYFDNNRYDVGLWCDALTHYGFSPIDESESAFSRINYNNLTDRIVGATKQEHVGHQSSNISRLVTEEHPATSLKLLSLNGRLGRSPPGSKYNWVESVYRGFTPQGLMTFMKHSCTPEAARKCIGSNAGCIVRNFEIPLMGAYPKGEGVEAIYPSFYPSDEEMKDWERRGVNMTGSEKIWGFDQWRMGAKYYQYLVDKFDFPLLKVKAIHKPNKRGLEKTVECYRMTNDSFFSVLVFPTMEILKAYHQRMSGEETVAFVTTDTDPSSH
ncbi:hypothetical protein QTG54_008575 [Skeletonema marinoi]|uniref:Uncharacterized protein n=1 Tax=Skeletonema marinoi TaxID=267567 RepID=A0AAD8Y8H2_9STRA|nr:hypothetical protein QTG54_008575 [Skeletonema marinoi]